MAIFNSLCTILIKYLIRFSFFYFERKLLHTHTLLFHLVELPYLEKLTIRELAHSLWIVSCVNEYLNRSRSSGFPRLKRIWCQTRILRGPNDDFHIRKKQNVGGEILKSQKYLTVSSFQLKNLQFVEKYEKSLI